MTSLSKKVVNMPADFLSRQMVKFLSAIDPFSSDLAKLQTVDSDIICIKHFALNASWPQGTPKSVANHLAPLAPNFFSKDNTVWIRLTDSKCPRTALFLLAQFHKWAMCEDHGTILSGHDADLKTYIRLTVHYIWPSMKSDIASHIKSCVPC